MDNIKVGSRVLTMNGQPMVVTHLHPERNIAQCQQEYGGYINLSIEIHKLKLNTIQNLEIGYHITFYEPNNDDLVIKSTLNDTYMKNCTLFCWSLIMRIKNYFQVYAYSKAEIEKFKQCIFLILSTNPSSRNAAEFNYTTIQDEYKREVYSGYENGCFFELSIIEEKLTVANMKGIGDFYIPWCIVTIISELRQYIDSELLAIELNK